MAKNKARKLLSSSAEKLRCRAGMSQLITFIFVTCSLILLANSGLAIYGQMVKLNNLQQMAQSIARTVSLEGRVDSSTYARLEDLEQLMRMEVDMRVDGEFVGGSDKLRLESDFTVYLSYKTKYGVGWIDWGREKTYVRQATGTAEEYYK